MSRFHNILTLLTPPLMREMAKHFLRPEHRKFASEYRRLRAMPRNAPAISRLLGGELELVDGRSFLTSYAEIFQRRIYDFRTSNPHPLILDCGANIGLAAIFFKTLFPDSQVIAFEPDLRIFEILQRNLQRFGLTSIQLHRKAVWTREGETDFFPQGGEAGRIAKLGDEKDSIRVPTVRLKDWLDRPVDFLKMDIEGAESDVLADCRNELKNVEHLFVEYHSHLRERQRLHELLQVLQEAGFRYHVKEAFTSANPYLHRKLNVGMDLQLNIFGYRV